MHICRRWQQSQTLPAEGFLATTANPSAVALTEDARTMSSHSGGKALFGGVHFRSRRPLRLCSAHGLQTGQTLWEDHTALCSWETERYVCELVQEQGRCGLNFTSWKKFMAHKKAHLVRKPRHQITTAHLCCHESTCQLWQYIHRLPCNTWTKGTGRSDRSHMTWSVEEAPQHQLQSFRALKGCKRATHISALPI